MIDIRQQINAVRRTVGERTLEAGEARVSTISQVYDTAIDDLWDVVTSAERINRWFLPITGELKEGGHYQLTGHAGGTITRCDRPRGFAATWEYGGDVSWIDVRLTVEDGGTRFELEHVAHVADEFWDQFGPGATGIGWEMGLLGLAGHLADPAAERPDATEWAASEAAVAAGADPEVAAARADRAYAAYTAG